MGKGRLISSGGISGCQLRTCVGGKRKQGGGRERGDHESPQRWVCYFTYKMGLKWTVSQKWCQNWIK